jgi:predicted alpha/beta hydrolase
MEQIDIRTSDGRALRTDVYEPLGHAMGIAVLAHAVTAHRGEFERPAGAGLARFFVDRGWRVMTFDFRGHGDSKPAPLGAGSYRYDDFVRWDLPAAHAFARSRARRKQAVVLLGHALGGHAGLAAQGVGLVAFDRIITAGANVWLRELEPSRLRWLAKRASLLTKLVVGRQLGRFPAAALRPWGNDESRAYVEDIERFARTGRWTSADGGVDYLSSLGSVRVPVLQIVSEGDRIDCAPDCGMRFVAHCGGRHELWHIERADDGGPAPDHMGLVTSGRTRATWDRAERWLRSALAE